MDVIMLSRLQFAVTAMFHFIFVPLTLGLSVLLAYMETLYVITNNELYLRMTKFWGKLFIINFVLGVVTGITMEFQFGMNWAGYSKYVGDIFGAPLAIEATVAFFLESTFIGLWIFGWNKISKKAHALAMWLVAFGTNLSAFWIIIANAWMQHPVGYAIKNGRAEMTNFWAVVSNNVGMTEFLHTIFAGYVVASFFVMGVSAYHLLKNNEEQLFKTSFKIAATFSLISALMVFFAGDFQASEVAEDQPTKFAAMESVWTTEKPAPYYLLIVPDERNEKNTIQTLKIPGMLSMLAFHNFNAEVKGLKAFPKSDRPPVLPNFISFRLMVGLGMLFILLSFLAFILIRVDMPGLTRIFLKIMLYAIPLPYIANFLGWTLAEVGRQPWIVYGVLKTSDAISNSVSYSQVLASFISFTVVYGVLAIVDIYLLTKYAKQVPSSPMQEY
jgi:cytochrome d ubiquinol oxidase subunit I